MADLKISQLTGATTPLAGTEVVPLVQSGVTKKVTVSDLTAGRAVSAAELTLTTGNLIVSSGKGIDFSATPGTGTSELFADYEEGTWTPDLRFGGGNTSMAGTFTGYYTKVGRTVNLQIRVALTNKGSSTGIATIESLPFTSSTFPAAIIDPSADFLLLIAGGATFVSLSGTSLYFLQQTTTGRTTMTQANFGNTADLRLEITYIV